MRYLLSVLVLVLITLMLVTPGEGNRANRRRNRQNRRNNQNTQSETKEEEEETEEQTENTTHLTCVSGHNNGITPATLKTCQTDLSGNCIKIFLAQRGNVAADRGHYIYGCKKPGFSCKTMRDYLKRRAPEGSWCKECQKKFNGCNADSEQQYEEVLATQDFEE
jgi:hypothetical protein